AVVLNVDDSYVSRIHRQVGEGVEVSWFGIDPSCAERLPELQEADVREADGAAALPEGAEAALLVVHDEQSFTITGSGADVGPVTLRQRGLAAMINATAATATAIAVLGAD